MAPRQWSTGLAAALALPGLLLGSGCVQEPDLPGPGTVVFDSVFPKGFEPRAFSGSRLNALNPDSYQTLDGAATLRIDVPAASAAPGFAGGPITSEAAQDLSRSTALSFWTKAARPAVLDKVGFGLNFAPFASTYQSTVFDLPLTTEWTRHVVPIPDPSRLTAERGLFWFAASDPGEYAFWFGDLRYVAVHPSILDLKPDVGATSLTLALGKRGALPVSLEYTDLDGTRRLLDSGDPGAGPAPAWFTFTSTDPAIATVDANGTIVAAAVGDARIRARLGEAELPRDLLVHVVPSIPAAPTAGPAAPSAAAADVISLFSDAYPNRPGVNFAASFSNNGAGANLANVVLQGNTVQRYTGLRFVGVDFVGNKIDARGMTHFHVDVWTPNATKFGVQLVSFPSSGGAVARTVGLNARTSYGGTISPMSQGAWISLDIPLARFGGLPLDSIGQLLWLDNGAISPGGDEDGTFFIDNVYFHR